jgi:hypothetical protein
MVLGDYQGHAERRYRFRFTGPWRAAVGFADGRPFHELQLCAGETAVEHLCGNDLYRGRYRLAGDHRWRLAWRITGPRKDLSLDTAYLRFSEEARPSKAWRLSLSAGAPRKQSPGNSSRAGRPASR